MAITEEVVEFEEADLEGGVNPDPTVEAGKKLSETLKFLKGILKPEDYANVEKLLGFQPAMTNEQLLEAITKLVKPGNEEDKDKKKKDKQYPDQLASYKEFMKDCMGKGKKMTECAKEYKSAYPEAKTTKEEETEIEQLSKEMEAAVAKALEKDQKLEKLSAKVTELEKERDKAVVEAQVNDLVTEKHLSPAQREMVINMAAPMKPEDRAGFFNVFRKQKFPVHEDAGKLGEGVDKGMDPKLKETILRKHGLADLIEEKGVKKDYSFVKKVELN